MYLSRLSLHDFRTFHRLELDLRPGLHVVTGPNASGKSNLLEAIALLATARSPRGGGEMGLIAWQALAEDPLPAARLVGRVESAQGTSTLEIVVLAPRDGERPPERASRRFRVNGVARRASDLIGRLRVVMFAAEDLHIIDGPPAGRRRYLDITISQLEPAYVRALQRYGRVLQQRNSLLRRLQERRARTDELAFWDGELAATGAILLAGRAGALSALGRDAAARYAELSPEAGSLEIRYRPGVPDELAETLLAAGLEERLRSMLVERRDDDIRAGLTRSGPHRDDIVFLVDGHEAGAFASRGQQRLAAVALRLAEVALSRERTGDPPVLLLDDILSEIDAGRRERVLAAAYGVDQVLITSADEERLDASYLPDARRYSIREGVLTPVSAAED